MLHTRLIHPDILEALAGAGHGATVLIADGHYPASTRLGPNARLVYLNLAPNLVTTTQILEALLSVVAFEGAQVMMPADGKDAPIFSDYQDMLSDAVPLDRIERFAFYEAASTTDCCLTIVSADTRHYANLLLTLGVRPNV